MMPDDVARRLEWAKPAREAYLATLAYIADEDPHTAALVEQRAERAFALILEQPGIGAAATRKGNRRYSIPNTGHVFIYRVTRRGIRIMLWYRARQNVRR
jgi:plasmid stabilization system protein ParE